VACYLAAFIVLLLAFGFGRTSDSITWRLLGRVAMVPVLVPMSVFRRFHEFKHRHQFPQVIELIAWVICALTLVVAYRFSRRRVFRAAMREAGNCQVCGYHLIATPDQCPECGTVYRLTSRR